MKTTLELPDDLARRIRMRAAARDRTRGAQALCGLDPECRSEVFLLVR